jgi:hypothetical protein
MRWLKDGNYVHFSATDGYQRRSNKPDSGMGAIDARTIATQGITLEVLAPSQNMTDAQMDSIVIEPYKHQVGEVFKVPNYVAIPELDIEAIASTIQATGKGVMVWFYFKIDEWTERPIVKYPGLQLGASDTLRHSVCAVDFTLINGKKCLIIEDSWGTSFGMAGQRIIDEDFFKARNWYRSYLVNFKFDEAIIPKPQYTFTVSLEFGQTNADIVALQNILKYEGLFPNNAASTGYYGAITAKGVYDFQVKRHVAPIPELDLLQGKKVGPKTINVLNGLYSN